MKSVYLLMTGALIISFSPIFVKLVFLGPTWIAFWRASIATFFLLFFAFKLPEERLRSFFSMTALSGTAIALDLTVWHKSLVSIGAGLGTLLGNTQVFYLALFGIFFFKEKLKFRTVFALGLAVIGMLCLVAIEIPLDVSRDQFYWGVTCGLLTGVAYAIFLILLRKVESEFPELTTLQKLFWVYFFCSLVLLVISIFNGEVTWPLMKDWKWLFLLGTLINLGGWKLITANLPNVSSSLSGMILLIQPAASTIWGVIFFKETLSIQQLIGIVLLFSGIYIQSKILT